MENKKYTFVEFISAWQDSDFDNMTEQKLMFGRAFLKSCRPEFENVHNGDCTKSSHPCSLCVLEKYLKDYKEYMFNEQKWRNENGC